MSRFLSPRFEALEAYTPGEQPRDQQHIKLNTNESPYPPSSEVLACLSKEEMERLRLYPDPEGKTLKDKLAKQYGVEGKNIFLSNGSDEILNFAFMAFCDGEKGVVFPEISYGFYAVYANLYQVPHEKMPLKEDFSVDYKDYLNTGKMVVIANPNAPTGMEIGLWEIEEILKSNPNQLVLIDEAYVDFGGTSSVELVKKYDNLLVAMTFSKSRSMAGARLGFALGSEEIIKDLEKIKFSTNPYNINRLTLLTGEAAVDSDSYYKENTKRIIKTRQKTASALTEMGFLVLPSKGNFLFAESPLVSGKTLYTKLKEKGILVRHFDRERIRNFIRITIGTAEEMEHFLKKAKEILEQERAGKKI